MSTPPSWDDLRVFLAAHRTGSLQKAAERLGIGVATASRRLASLEKCVGVRLFARSPGGLRPTRAAAAVVADAERMERLAGGIARRLDGLGAGLRGVVQLATTGGIASTVLVPFLPDLRAAHPGLTLDLLVGTALVDLEAFEADLALRPVRPRSGAHLVSRRLRRTRYAPFASRRHLARHGVGRPLESHPWIGPGSEPADHPFERLRRRVAPESEVALRVAELRTATDAVRAGLGVALLPVSLARVHPDLMELPMPEAQPEAEGALWLVGHEATRSTPRIDAVWGFLVDLLGEENDAEAPGTRLAGRHRDAFFGARGGDPEPAG
ncbi:MAG: LysR family transcriptional regulator [Myxococcota bacterium]